MVASVRPWKEALAVMMTGKSSPSFSCACLRVSLMAASFASAPELQKKALGVGVGFGLEVFQLL